ncbi:hypothetical protein FUAX_09540 [Fulvitalea axinellae]|uniref:Uncharacterized protein n=2 Tax=Fulvitalea axinellae TaxID=1182444 RepID=A0AAU9CNK6_9BACT|nr:hypothetical protein FUAX_09540 [Fulvitalea axinellae]
MMRWIQTLTAALDRIMHGRNDDNTENSEKELEKAYTEFFGKDRAYFRGDWEPEKEFGKDEEGFLKAEYMAKLLLADADAQTGTDKEKELLEKAESLLLFLEQESGVASFERMGLLASIGRRLGRK